MVRHLRRPKLGALLAAGLAAALLGGPALAAQISGSSQGPSPATAKAATAPVHRSAEPGTIQLSDHSRASTTQPYAAASRTVPSTGRRPAVAIAVTARASSPSRYPMATANCTGLAMPTR